MALFRLDSLTGSLLGSRLGSRPVSSRPGARLGLRHPLVQGLVQADQGRSRSGLRLGSIFKAWFNTLPRAPKG